MTAKAENALATAEQKGARRRSIRFALAACFAALALVAGAAPIRAIEDEAAATMDRVFARVAFARKEIEGIRLEMGEPRSEPSGIAVTNAGTREVFFAVQNMFGKANRLSFEQAREMAPTPEAPVGEILPFDISVVVTATLMRLREVKAKLGISEPTTEPPTIGMKTPSEVFVSVIEANRQLDLLLNQRVGPSDVFQKVTLAVGYAARLLARFPGQSRIPEAPPFEPKKFPADVYRRLLSCFDSVRSVMKDSGFDTLELHSGEGGYGWVTTGDTYELASLIVAELSYLHSQIPAARAPRNVYYPGRKVHAHVYQRAGVLEAQLHNLQRWVTRDRRWLTRAETE
jgi:hypothetical protein